MKQSLNFFPTESVIEIITEVVSTATAHGKSHALSLIDDLVEGYEKEAHTFLTAEAKNVEKLISLARTVAQQNPSELDRVLARLEQVVRNWDRVAQPIQLSAQARGTRHESSGHVAFAVRGLAVDLYNKFNLLDGSRRLAHLLEEVFAEVPQVAETVGEDVVRLKELERKRQEYATKLTYQAEIGIIGKNTLRISPDGIEWKGQRYSLDEITSVRWGGVRQSINGIPTGTTFTVGFEGARTVETITLRREEVYSEFLKRLWMGVCNRLCVEMLMKLKAGQQLTFGDVVVSDQFVILRKRAFLRSSEAVSYPWSKVRFWNADGRFLHRCG